MANPLAVLSSHGVRITKDGVHFSKPIYYKGIRVFPPEGVTAQEEQEYLAERRTIEEEREVKATRAAKQLAEREGLDLSEVRGSGMGGEILVSDVEQHFEVSRLGGSEEVAAADDGPPAPTEAAQNLAEEHGIDLSQIKGTGEKGRVKLQDVQDYLDSLEEDEPEEGEEE